MSLKQLAFLFIGQTPRPDTMEEMRRFLPSFPIREYGALDGLQPEVIAAEYAPCSDADLLISRLQDGTSVQISEKRLIERLQQKLKQAVAEGAQLCVLMCTGSFPSLRCAVPVLTMDDALHRQLILGPEVGCIGLIVPLPGQQERFAAQYAHLQRNVVTAAASPYEAAEQVVMVAQALKEKGADCICLDCMGYTDVQAEQVMAAVGLPVYTPRRETAKQILKWAETL